MTPDEELAAYREAVLTVMHDGLATVTLAFALLVLLVATAVVRHW